MCECFSILLLDTRLMDIGCEIYYNRRRCTMQNIPTEAANIVPGEFEVVGGREKKIILGDGDEKKNRSFAFNHDKNDYHSYPLPSGR